MIAFFETGRSPIASKAAGGSKAVANISDEDEELLARELRKIRNEAREQHIVLSKSTAISSHTIRRLT